MTKQQDDDIIPAIELMQWRVGRVLTQQDIDIIARYLKEVDEDEELYLSQMEAIEKACWRQLGGEELVIAMETLDTEAAHEAVQKALEKFRLRMDARAKSAN